MFIKDILYNYIYHKNKILIITKINYCLYFKAIGVFEMNFLSIFIGFVS